MPRCLSCGHEQGYCPICGGDLEDARDGSLWAGIDALKQELDLSVQLREAADKRIGELEAAKTLYDLLREFITPPLAYSKKQDAVAKARMLLEEWKEVER